MAIVMGSSRLHRALTQGRLPAPVAATNASARLGNWAAILVDGSLVVAIEERTCLTLVVQLAPVTGLRDRFAAALRRALLDCGVSLDATEQECRVLHEASFAGRRQPALRDALAFAEMETGAHADGGQQPQSIQAMLNTYPYAECAASCPTEAVFTLFGIRSVS